MTELEPHLGAIHPDWCDGWAKGLPRPLRSAVLGSPRLAGRLGPRIAAGEAPALDGASRTSPDLRDYALFIEDPQRVLRVAGLMRQAGALSRVLDGPLLKRLAAVVPVDDIVLVLHHQALLPEIPDEAGEALDPDRVVPDGTALVRAWAGTLPAALARRVAMTLPRLREDAAPREAGAASIVRAAMTALRARNERMFACPQ